jgi:hypothetical protein
MLIHWFVSARSGTAWHATCVTSGASNRGRLRHREPEPRTSRSISRDRRRSDAVNVQDHNTARTYMYTPPSYSRSPEAGRQPISGTRHASNSSTQDAASSRTAARAAARATSPGRPRRLSAQVAAELCLRVKRLVCTGNSSTHGRHALGMLFTGSLRTLLLLLRLGDALEGHGAR